MKPLDKIAWTILKEKEPVPLEDSSVRPRNYKELQALLEQSNDFERAWSEFLHSFFLHQDPSQLVYPSPKSLSPRWQALLAGTAEWLAHEFNLPQPPWVYAPQYFLEEEWDVASDWIDLSDSLNSRRACTEPEFLKRNIVFDTRNLITL